MRCSVVGLCAGAACGLDQRGVYACSAAGSCTSRQASRDLPATSPGGFVARSAKPTTSLASARPVRSTTASAPWIAISTFAPGGDALPCSMWLARQASAWGGFQILAGRRSRSTRRRLPLGGENASNAPAHPPRQLGKRAQPRGSTPGRTRSRVGQQHCGNSRPPSPAHALSTRNLPRERATVPPIAARTLSPGAVQTRGQRRLRHAHAVSRTTVNRGKCDEDHGLGATQPLARIEFSSVALHFRSAAR